MKVLLINGSPRHKGNTFVALNEIAQQLEKQGVESEIMWIGNKAVRGCIACNQCRTNAAANSPQEHRCVFGDQDITNQVIEKMAECDAIILGSPVYWGQPSGQLLCLQQRMLYAGGANFQGKPAAAEIQSGDVHLGQCVGRGQGKGADGDQALRRGLRRHEPGGHGGGEPQDG